MPLDDALYEIPAPNPDATADAYIPDDVSISYAFDKDAIICSLYFFISAPTCTAQATCHYSFQLKHSLFPSKAIKA